MRHKWIWTSLLSVALVASGEVRHLSAAPPEGYIVVLKDNALNTPAVAAEHARNFGVGLRYVYGHALKGYAAVIAPERLADVQNDPRVLFVSADRPVWAFAQTLPTGVDRIEGERSSHFVSGVSRFAVAVIDTGSGPHPDLSSSGARTAPQVEASMTETATAPMWQGPSEPLTRQTGLSVWRPESRSTPCAS